MRRIRLHDWADPDRLDGAATAVAIAEIELVDDGPVTRVVVRGLSVGVAQVTVTLTLGESRSVTATTPVDSRWRSEATVVPDDSAGVLIVEAVGDGTSAVADRVGVALPDTGAPLSVGTQAGETAGMSGFLAGTSDRLAQRRTYVPLVGTPIPTHPWAIPDQLFLLADNAVAQLSSKRAVKLLAPEVARLHGQLVRGSIDEEAYSERVEKAIAKAVTASIEPAPRARRDDWNSLFDRRTRRARTAAPTVSRRPAIPGAHVLVRHQGAYYTALATPAVVRWLQQAVLAESSIGLVFLDRVRYQPAGLFVGEPLCTLSLTPGEEVQVRQTVETKRRATLEEIREREQERAITLSSTWSTDVSEAATESEARSSTTTVSANLTPGELPIPISGGVNGSGTVTGAHDKNQEVTLARTFEQSSEATARMRAQHRTRIEVTTESTTGLATTRTVRNANHQRAVTYVFSKIYRRERATLERYGARLCLRLSVADPSGSTRNAFLRGLDLIDPDNPALYEAVLPQAVQAERVLTQTDLPRLGSVSAGGGRETRQSGLLNLRDVLPDAQRPPDGFRLLSARPVLWSWRYADTDNPDEDRDYGFGEADGRFFGQWEGAIAWFGTPPIVGEPDPQGAVQVEYRYESSDSEAEDSYRRGPTRVQVQLQTLWAPDNAEWSAVRDQRESRRAELVASCTPDAVAALRATADRDYRGGVLATALLAAFGDQADAVGLQLHRLLDLDEAYVDTVPWWATEDGRDRYEALLSRIRRLPIDISLTDATSGALTDAHAFVHIPIREGKEAELLKLMPGVLPNDRTRWLKELTELREESFTVATPMLPSHFDVLGPKPPTGTAAGSDRWNTEFEKPTRKFLVLGQWSEAIPTDGVHTEMVLSDTVATDEHRVAELERGTRLHG